MPRHGSAALAGQLVSSLYGSDLGSLIRDLLAAPQREQRMTNGVHLPRPRRRRVPRRRGFSGRGKADSSTRNERQSGMGFRITSVRPDDGSEPHPCVSCGNLIRHDVKQAERRADNAESAALIAIDYADATIEEAEYAVVDAILARAEADEAAADETA